MGSALLFEWVVVVVVVVVMVEEDMVTVPDVGCCNPPMSFNSADLPEDDAPTMRQNSDSKRRLRLSMANSRRATLDVSFRQSVSGYD